MAPSARVQAAFRAMKDIGISEQKTKPVLKKLLQAYEKNWKVIEEENYRLLADAIFEDEDTGTSGNEKILETVDARQVFWTAEGKGWGVRTLDKLPKGAFVCEYVGEILTISELHQRSVERKSNEKHSYAMILDADWGSGDLQDNQTLCLDSTFYGNVARFINHRCFDANLVEIPVQIETPDCHYYHVAFFTTREVNALEELTWDYGIDFDDQDNLLKTFNCLCGSKFCRDMKRSNRSRSISNVH